MCWFWFFFSFLGERNKCCGCILKHGINVYYLNLYYQIIELVDANMWNNFICLMTREMASYEDILAGMLLQVTQLKPFLSRFNTGQGTALEAEVRWLVTDVRYRVLEEQFPRCRSAKVFSPSPTQSPLHVKARPSPCTSLSLVAPYLSSNVLDVRS